MKTRVVVYRFGLNKSADKYDKYFVRSSHACALAVFETIIPIYSNSNAFQTHLVRAWGLVVSLL